MDTRQQWLCFSGLSVAMGLKSTRSLDRFINVSVATRSESSWKHNFQVTLRQHKCHLYVHVLLIWTNVYIAQLDSFDNVSTISNLTKLP